jgi:hypothetical protein
MCESTLQSLTISWRPTTFSAVSGLLPTEKVCEMELHLLRGEGGEKNFLFIFDAVMVQKKGASRSGAYRDRLKRKFASSRFAAPWMLRDYYGGKRDTFLGRYVICHTAIRWDKFV